MFNAKAFTKTKMEQRTAVVPVPELAQWFANGETAEFTVRGLTGAELSVCESAKIRQEKWETLISKAELSDENIDTLMMLLAPVKGLTAVDIYQIELLFTVFPSIDRPSWRLVFDRFPYVVKRLSSKIIELTAMGYAEVKPPPCGETQISEQA